MFVSFIVSSFLLPHLSFLFLSLLHLSLSLSPSAFFPSCYPPSLYSLPSFLPLLYSSSLLPSPSSTLTLPPSSLHSSPLLHQHKSSTPSAPPRDAQPPEPSSTSTPTSPYHDPKRKQQSVRTFLAQKVFRTRQGTNLRKLLLWFLTILSLLLSWFIGYSQQSFAVMILLVIAMAIFWREQSSKLVQAVEQEAELRLRRKKTVQQSETAEWMNLAIKRW